MAGPAALWQDYRGDGRANDGRLGLAPLGTAAIWTATGDPAWMLGTLLGVALLGAVGFWFAALRSGLR